MWYVHKPHSMGLGVKESFVKKWGKMIVIIPISDYQLVNAQ